MITAAMIVGGAICIFVGGSLYLFVLGTYGAVAYEHPVRWMGSILGLAIGGLGLMGWGVVRLIL